MSDAQREGVRLDLDNCVFAEVVGLKGNIATVYRVFESDERVNSIVGDVIDLAFPGINAVGHLDLDRYRAVGLDYVTAVNEVDIVEIHAYYRAADGEI